MGLKDIVEAAETIHDLSSAPVEFLNRYNYLVENGYPPEIAFNRTNFEYQCELGVSISTSKYYSTIAWGATIVGIVIGGLEGGIVTFPTGVGVYPGMFVGGVTGYGLAYGGLTISSDIATKLIAEKLGEKFYPCTDSEINYNNPLNYNDFLHPARKYFEKGTDAGFAPQDPIILDLNGDGIRTTTVANGTYFDYADDGFAESTAWVDYNDGILVTDTNANGKIDNQSELITSLSAYDTNGDGVINSSDSSYNSLKILKGDGTLQTLTEAGIASINTTTTTTGTIDSSSNTQDWSGTYTKLDGTTLTLGDYQLQTNTAYSVETSTVPVSDTISELPDVSSYGTLHSLHQAMALDTTGNLTTLVQNFVAETTASNRWTDLQNILYKWTGADVVSATSRGEYVNAQHLAVVEKFMGQNFVQTNYGSNPTQEAGDFLEMAYIAIENLVYGQLMSQSTLKDLFNEITISYNSTTGTLSYDLTNVITALQSAITADATTGKELVIEFATALKGLGLDTSSNYQSLTDTSDFYHTFTANDRDLKWQLDIIGKSYDLSVQSGEGTAKDDAMKYDGTTGVNFHTLEGDDVVFGGSGNDNFGLCSGNDIADGGAGNDFLLGCNGNDTLYGSSGNDILQGGSDDDILIGGTDDDFLNGGANDDKYIFNLGDGHDTITDDYGNDSIVFGEGITVDNITITVDGNNKIITYGTQGDNITILNQAGTNVIDNIQFSDGTIWVISDKDLEHIITGTSGDDSLISINNYELVNGGAGNDTISATVTGNHMYHDTAGNDTYVINQGDGNVYIEDATGIDTIRFGDGFNASNTMFIADEDNNLTITFTNSSDIIVIENQFDPNYTIENFVFSDGTTLTNTSILSNIVIRANGTQTTINGGNQAETIYGNDLGNIINGGSLNDTINAGTGNDLINDPSGTNYIDGNSGDDTIYSGSRNDTIKSGDGNDLVYAGAGNDSIYNSNGDDTIYAGDGNDTIYNDFYSSSNNYIDGGNGNNYVFTRWGNDTIYTGDGDDTIYDSSGNNYIDGGNGHNYVFIGSGNDTIYSGDGSDTLESGDGNDLIFAGAGDDYISSGNGDDTVYGNAGNDSIFSYSGNGTVYGDAGNDFIFSYNGNNTIYGGDGNDTIYTDQANSEANYIDGGAGDDSIIGFESTDIIIGGTGNDYLASGAGNDTYIFNLGDGNDTIWEVYIPSGCFWELNAGINDTVSFGPGITKENIIFTGEGEDLIISYKNSTDSIRIYTQLSNGNRQIENFIFADGTSYTANEIFGLLTTYGTDSDETITGSIGYDRIYAYGGNDSISANCFSGNDTIYAGDGNDTVNIESYSNNNSNYIDGGAGNDYLYSGSTGNDTVIGGTGNDSITNWSGNDIYIFNSGDGNDTIYDWGGTDTLLFGPGLTKENIRFTATGNGHDIVVYFTNTSDSIMIYENYIENFIFSDGTSYTSDEVSLLIENHGTSFDDTMTDTDYSEKIYGESGNDSLCSNHGNDTIYGGDGNDTIMMNYNYNYDSNNNYINGGTGDDFIYDGRGNDIYSFNIGDGNDTITDGSGTDTLLFGPGISKENIRFTATGNGHDIVVYFTNTSDSIMIYENYIENFIFSDGTSYTSDEVSLLIENHGTNFDDTMTDTDYSEKIYGESGNDSIYSIHGNDTIYGGDGNDTITATYGNYNYDAYNNYIDAGTGNDSIYDQRGNDTYSFNIGDGNDTITDGSGTDTLLFGPGISKENIRFSATGEGNDILVYFSNTSDSIMIKGNYIENFVFSDGINYTSEDVSRLIENHGTSFDDTITDTDYSEKIYGESGNDSLCSNHGNDTIYGGDGNDTIMMNYNYNYDSNNNYINGGTGDDFIYDGRGNDTYSFNIGDGNDIITDTSGDDAILFDGTVGKNNIAMYIDSNNNLIIDYGSDLGSDQITVLSQSTNTIEQIKLSDGEYITSTEINSLIQNMTAYATSNSIEFTGISDVKNNQDLMNLVSSSWHS